MKAVILAGGPGTRLSELTGVRPKPMVEVGSRPLLWHIMKTYAHHGVEEFVICLGYKGSLIRDYFANAFLHAADVTFDLAAGSMEVHSSRAEPWRVTLVETGDETMTGGRLKRALPFLGDDDEFCLTYGDGLADVDVRALIDFHRRAGVLATLTAVQPPGRFGALAIEGDRVVGFQEKPVGDGQWVNGGFFVLSRAVGDYIAGDATTWEREPMERLARESQLARFEHHGFWHPVDSLRDLTVLQELWAGGSPPWRVWT